MIDEDSGAPGRTLTASQTLTVTLQQYLLTRLHNVEKVPVPPDHAPDHAPGHNSHAGTDDTGRAVVASDIQIWGDSE